ncbi:MAG TPA: type II toxin-antitoxin system PemK/MazF family toxin [Candidatus Lokiarchaeia archaeon]|nr:type II toxin-antitoxin system PemK/MazF family toxin [Candidatus Lokiarchaeia archaeon]
MTPSTMSYKCGDVVLLPFPFTDLTSTKKRPAVVISSDWFNLNRKDVIVIAITSQIPKALTVDELLFSPAEQNLAGLPKKSIVKVTKIVTVDQLLIIKKIGICSKQNVRKLKRLLNKFVG